MFRIRTADPDAPKQVGLILAGVRAGSAVKHLADIDAMAAQLFSSRLEFRDNEVHSLAGPGRRRRNIFSEDDRAPGARRSELDYAKVFTGVVVGVEPPSQPRVKFLRAVYVGNGDDDNFELQVGWRGFCVAGHIAAADWLSAHGCLLVCVISLFPF